MTQTTAQVWALFVAISMLTGIVVTGLAWLIWKVVDFGRDWFILLSGDGTPDKLVKARAKNGQLVMKKAGKAIPLDGTARRTLGRRGLFLLDAEKGWSYTPLGFEDRDDFIQNYTPTIPPAVRARGDEATRAWVASLRVKLMALSPELIFNHTRTTVFQRWLRSKEDKPDWRVQIAPLALIAIIVLCGIVGFLTWKMNGGGA